MNQVARIMCNGCGGIVEEKEVIDQIVFWQGRRGIPCPHCGQNRRTGQDRRSYKRRVFGGRGRRELGLERRKKGESDD